jgi:hypothetical protein
LWAGANPWRKFEDPDQKPEDGFCAAEQFCFSGNLTALRPPLPAEQLDQLLHWSSFSADAEMARFLVNSGANPNGRIHEQHVVDDFIHPIQWGSIISYRSTSSHQAALQALLALGVVWGGATPEEIKLVRWFLLKMPRPDAEVVLVGLGEHKCVSNGTL